MSCLFLRWPAAYSELGFALDVHRSSSKGCYKEEHEQAGYDCFGSFVGCATNVKTHAVRGVSGVEIDCSGLGAGGAVLQARCERM